MINRSLKLVISFLIVISLSLTGLSLFSCQAGSSTTFQVSRVIDGDTIEINYSGKAYPVRYIGVDTPEVGQPFSYEATQKNRELVEGKRVYLEKDISDTDKYGRLLCYVYFDNLFINAELVRSGYAYVATFPPDVKYQNYFVELQSEAREAGRGLWARSPSTPSIPSQNPQSSPSVPSFTAPVIPTKPPATTYTPKGTTPAPTYYPTTPLANVRYVGTVKSNKYHYPNCMWAKEIHPENEIWFNSVTEAKAKGYVPCKVCNPPN